MRSRAEFEDALAEVQTLVSLAGSQNVVESELGSRSAKRSVENAVFRSATLMSVAHFEGFLKNILQEFVDETSDRKPPSRNIPMSLRELMSRAFFEEIVRADPEKRPNKIKKSIGFHAQMWSDSSVLRSEFLSSKKLQRELTSANPEVVEKCFAYLEIEDILSAASSEINKDEAITEGFTVRVDVASELTNLVRTRNAIAHGNLQTKPTKQEVLRAVRLLTATATAIESIVESRLQAVCSL